MAETSGFQESSSNTQIHQSRLSENEKSRLSELRNQAQNHLNEIGRDLSNEEVEAQRRQSEVEQYSKRRTSSRSKSPQETAPSEMVKGPCMRTAQEVLDRLRWDDSLDIAQYRVGYLERFDGLREMQASSWIRESTDEDWIPQHRIKYFKKISGSGTEEIVWHRDQRIDRIFGSGVVK